MIHRSEVIGDLIEKHGLGIGAEIGVGSGPTCRALMERFPTLKWIAVDHYPTGYPDGRGEPMTPERQDNVRSVFSRLYLQYRPRLQYIDKPSTEAASQIEDLSLDIVFIDDDHSYEGCRASIEAWAPKIRPGGWLTGHDYCHAYPGVIRAVDEIVKDPILKSDSVWIKQL